LKNIHKKYIITTATFILLLACSTKKDNFATRNFQALNTKYNVLFNGGVALDKGIVTVETQYQDNYWQTLPVERQQPKVAKTDEPVAKNPDFELSELKATKAIQRRSMNIDGSERNTQIDEAYLMLGKSRYFDQRFIPALEAFNYILYKYPKSDKIYDAKIWVEKTNMRLDNDGLAIENLTKLLKEIKFKNQTFADANAILAEAYIKINKKDSAINRLRTAIKFTKINEEKARFKFIKAQLFEQINEKDSAFDNYQSIIDMKRKSPRVYTMHAQARQAQQFNFNKGDTIVFLKKYNQLLNDRENRSFLDVLNHQLGLCYDESKNPKQAKKYYNKSLRNKSQDSYLEASNYRNIANINFYAAKYVAAGKYYDSTMTKLKPRTREFNFIKKKRENLDDVIKYEGIAVRNDSILNVLNMSEPDRLKFYENYISLLKSNEIKQKLIAEKNKSKSLKTENQASSNAENQISESVKPNKGFGAPPLPEVNSNSFSGQSNFYFYNSTTVSYGRLEFKKNWGDRSLKDNWRTVSTSSNSSNEIEEEKIVEKTENVKNLSENIKKTADNSQYDATTYLAKLPKKQQEIDILIKDRNFAYFQLGTIYKEKFSEYKLAQDKLESLLTKNPEEKLILPAMYNLYKIYEITDLEKAAIMKAEIIKKYPKSRYAYILLNSDSNNLAKETPQIVYNDLYKMYKDGEYRSLFGLIDPATEKFNGDEIVPKLELLKANNIGKVKGLNEFKKALNNVSLSYPDSQEGKDAEMFVTNDIVAMEALQFNLEKPLSWKLIFRLDCNNDNNAKPLLQKITKFINTQTYYKLTTSTDLYLMDEDFIVIHNIKDELQAKDITSILKEFKDYKVSEIPIIISSDNYKIVQIKKNLDEYLKDPKKVAKPVAKKEPVQPKQVKEAPNAIKKLIEENQKKSKTNTRSMSPPGSMPQQTMQGEDPVMEQQMMQKKL
jgi:Tetratricopeptide repeat